MLSIPRIKRRPKHLARIVERLELLLHARCLGPWPAAPPASMTPLGLRSTCPKRLSGWNRSIGAWDLSKIQGLPYKGQSTFLLTSDSHENVLPTAGLAGPEYCLKLELLHPGPGGKRRPRFGPRLVAFGPRVQPANQ
jgi:hypothetical protein